MGFAACRSAKNEESDTGGDSGSGPDAGVDAGGGDTGTDLCAQMDPSLAEQDAKALFEYPHVPTFDLYLPQEAWEDLQANATAEEYTPADACFEGRGIGEVGLRFKGSYGSLAMCFDENGVNTCRKLSMKLKFDKYDEEKRFYGLKRLNLHGNRFDDTYLREKLSYDLFRAADIKAPRALWAEVRVNGEPMGLYGMVEQVDGRFTADRWPDNPDGNLYKEAWPVITDAGWLTTDGLRTNRGKNPDVNAFVSFSEAMLAADDASLRATLGTYMDLGYLARYMAVDDLITNYDGVTAIYTGDDGLWTTNHNYYIYEEAPTRFTLIPWDLESTFQIGTFGNVPHWTQKPGDCNATYTAWGMEELQVIAPGCDRVIQALVADLTGYRQAGRQLLDGPFDLETKRNTIEGHAEFIREAAHADPHGPGIDAFEGGVELLNTELEKLRERMAFLISGESWTPFEIATQGITDFEDQDSFGLIMGPSLYYNSSSRIDLTVNSDTPIDGARSFRMGLEFGEESEPWGQWVQYRVPLDVQTLDATAITGIRMLVRADSRRTIRVDINSPHATGLEEGAGWGWDIPATEEATLFELPFAEAEAVWWAIAQGIDVGADLATVLQTMTGLVFAPQCNGQRSSGYLPEGTTDVGAFEMDNIEFF